MTGLWADVKFFAKSLIYKGIIPQSYSDIPQLSGCKSLKPIGSQRFLVSVVLECFRYTLKILHLPWYRGSGGLSSPKQWNNWPAA